jgi:hypothetical protein
VVREDHLLDEQVGKASSALMELRWHWTLDESNPDRVSFSEYAREVGQTRKTITGYAQGWLLVEADPNMTATEARERAAMSAETEVAAEAVAKARGIGFERVSKSRRPEVRRVREWAREAAEQKGTSVEAEVEGVAEFIVKGEQAAQSDRAAKAERKGVRYVALEGRLVKAQRALHEALDEALAVEWGAEEQELLGGTIATVRRLLDLVDQAIAGSSGIDWDKALAELSETEAA